ncbi:hypothetical protein D9M69_456870 [compost metagenome]
MELVLLQFLDKARDIARVGDQHAHAAAAHPQQAADRQREDVVERQRGDGDDLVDMAALGQRRLHPGLGLQHVGDHVTVQQHRALAHAGGAAGVLQEGDVIRSGGRRLQRELAAFGQHAVEAHTVGQLPRRHHLLDVAHHEVDDRALQSAEHVAHAGDHHVLDRRARQHRLQRGGKVLQDDNGLGAAVLELVLQLARGVKRIDVDHHEAGAQHRGQHHRILQHVRHHDCHARAGTQPARLQPRGKARRHLVEFAVGDGLVHADEGLAVGIGAERRFEQLGKRTKLAGINLGGDAGRVVFQPNSFHSTVS